MLENPAVDLKQKEGVFALSQGGTARDG